MDIVEFVIRESDGEDEVYICVVATAIDRIELEPSERQFLFGLLPKRSEYLGEGLWKCQANSNIVNRLLVNGVRLGVEGGRADTVMQWHIDTGNITVEEDDDDEDDNPWAEDEIEEAEE